MRRSTSPHTITARVPEPLRGAVDAATARSFVSQAAYLRLALAEKLERDGYLSPQGRGVRRTSHNEAA
jgi:hypothetical protein